MSDLAGLPSIRWSLRGFDDEGNEAWLIRNISQKLYRCPGCHGEIEIGSEHVVVQYVLRLGGTEHHHWHRRCAEELLVPELRQLKRVPANESSRSKLEARGRQAAWTTTAPLSVAAPADRARAPTPGSGGSTCGGRPGCCCSG